MSDSSSRRCRRTAEEELERSLRPRRSTTSSARSASRSSSRSHSRRRRRAARRSTTCCSPGRRASARPRSRRSCAASSASASGRSPARRSSARATSPRSSPTLEPRDVLFVDEIHRLNRAVEEILYPALEDFRLDIIVGQGPAARTLTLDLPPFTLVGATTRTGLLTTPLRDRFGLDVPARPLHARRAGAIVTRAARASSASRSTTTRPSEIARRSRGTPRIANRILRRVRDVAEVRHAGVDHDSDRRGGARRCSRWTRPGSSGSTATLLRAVVEKFGGGPVGLSTLAVSLGEEPETIEDVYEPYLLQLGFLQRTPRGRIDHRARPRARRRRADCGLALLSFGASPHNARVSCRRARPCGCRGGVGRGRATCSCCAAYRATVSCTSAAAAAARAGPGSIEVDADEDEARCATRSRTREPVRIDARRHASSSSARTTRTPPRSCRSTRRRRRLRRRGRRGRCCDDEALTVGGDAGRGRGRDGDARRSSSPTSWRSSTRCARPRRSTRRRSRRRCARSRAWRRSRSRARSARSTSPTADRIEVVDRGWELGEPPSAGCGGAEVGARRRSLPVLRAGRGRAAAAGAARPRARDPLVLPARADRRRTGRAARRAHRRGAARLHAPLPAARPAARRRRRRSC